MHGLFASLLPAQERRAVAMAAAHAALGLPFTATVPSAAAAAVAAIATASKPAKRPADAAPAAVASPPAKRVAKGAVAAPAEPASKRASSASSAAATVSKRARGVVATEPASNNSASLTWLTLPDELWLRIFRLGWPDLPMGRLRMVCRRFRGLATEVAGRPVPAADPMPPWCYHCFATFGARKEFTQHVPYPICADCKKLPMYAVYNRTQLKQLLGLEKEDLPDDRGAFMVRNPNGRTELGNTKIPMFTFDVAEAIARAKWGVAYVRAVRHKEEVDSNRPFPASAAAQEEAAERAKAALAAARKLAKALR